jgi:hypothetical protein
MAQERKVTEIPDIGIENAQHRRLHVGCFVPLVAFSPYFEK